MGHNVLFKDKRERSVLAYFGKTLIFGREYVKRPFIDEFLSSGLLVYFVTVI